MRNYETIFMTMDNYKGTQLLHTWHIHKAFLGAYSTISQVVYDQHCKIWSNKQTLSPTAVAEYYTTLRLFNGLFSRTTWVS